jgi:F-type H+-transporting ATPase subunit alpha
MHSQHGEVRGQISSGDWSEEVQGKLREILDTFAKDFGYDLDEEGQPMDDDAPPSSTSPDAPAADEREKEAQPA